MAADLFLPCHTCSAYGDSRVPTKSCVVPSSKVALAGPPLCGQGE